MTCEAKREEHRHIGPILAFNLRRDFENGHVTLHGVMNKAFDAGLAEGRKLGAKNAVSAMAGLEELRKGGFDAASCSDTIPPEAERVPVVVDADPAHDAEERAFLISYFDEDEQDQYFTPESPVFAGNIRELECYLTGVLDASNVATLEDLRVSELHECSVTRDEHGNIVVEAP